MTTDFSHKDPRNHDFRGQNLRGARFTGADLRGACFQDANLTGADFSGARLGKGLRGWIFTVLAGLVIGLLVGFLEGFAGLLWATVINEVIEVIQGTDTAQHGRELIVLTVGGAVGMVTILLFFVWRKGIAGLSLAMGVILALAVTGVGFVPAAGALVGAVAVAGVGAMVGALTGVGIGVLAGVGIGVGTVAISWILAWDGAVAVIEAGALAGAIFLLPALYIAWRIRQDDPRFAGLRQWGLWLGSLGGTDFRGADLTGASFRAADLKHSRFAGVKTLEGADFREAKRIRLAYAAGTLLENPRVRDLLVNGDGKGKSYAGLNLKGAVLVDARLSGANFSEANLSNADLTDADLRKSKLIRTQLIGANLSKARLTGACIESWNIDKRTTLQGIDCDYVFLEEGNPESRQPPSGAFEPGEFSKLFQEVTETIDFIVESRLELKALQIAVRKLREDGAEGLEVQGVERKGEAAAVRMAVPPEMDWKQTHARMLREKELDMKLLEAEHKTQLAETQYFMEKEYGEKQVDNFKELFNNLLNNLPSGTYIDHINAPGGTVNLGKIEERLRAVAENIEPPLTPNADAEAEAQASEELEELLARLARSLESVSQKQAEAVVAMVEAV
uniref:Pentapeptide repeat-containing protein n=1 Tax=Candidatus Kentrum eta TaxID=2126337 RepID=A0A450UA38_9GAMM|nr:MAG: Pentapeptide repeat-containing protein [Candidatus Kentron sp. H]VFJ89786.1 MAG: Pentapeptide repeat-containing protein [Candidatus Kentron sp. H]VFJ97167.1 MAG: Pentapeptide repeat-containing protein [Candidatus Kentron sp. H]